MRTHIVRKAGGLKRVVGGLIAVLLVAGNGFAWQAQGAPSGAPAPGDSSTPPNGVEIEIGIASRISGPAISNYQTSNGVLSLTNLGRATPQLLTGLGFSCDTSSSTPDTGKYCGSWAKNWHKHT